MRMLNTSRFQDADKYAAYLKTPAGRLRSEFAAIARYIHVIARRSCASSSKGAGP
jgi:hypothetical protein